jgi:hypothetical protein
MSFEDAINYPRSGDDPLPAILIGGILTMLGMFVLPLVVVLGYLMQVLAAAIGDDSEPPRFEDWGQLLFDGVKAFAIGFIYLLIPTVVFGVSVGGLVLEAVLTGDVTVGTVAGSLAGFAISGLLALLAWYVIPAALANAADTGRFAAGFAFGDIRPVMFSGGYATAWLLALVLFVVGGAIVGFLGAIPPLGFVVGGFVFFYLDVVAFYLYGRAYAKADRPEKPTAPPAGQPA